jgi:hypothetical protein
MAFPALVAQGIERSPPERKVAGSNPVGGTDPDGVRTFFSSRGEIGLLSGRGPIGTRKQGLIELRPATWISATRFCSSPFWALASPLSMVSFIRSRGLVRRVCHNRSRLWLTFGLCPPSGHLACSGFLRPAEESCAQPAGVMVDPRPGVLTRLVPRHLDC